MSGFGNISTIPLEDDIISALQAEGLDARLRAVTRLRSIFEKDANWAGKFRRKADLFAEFNRILLDGNWELQNQVIKFMADTMKSYRQDIDWCMALVLQNLVVKLGSNRITIRRMTSEAIKEYLIHTHAMQTLQRVLIFDGIMPFRLEYQHQLNALRELSALFDRISIDTSKDWTVFIGGLCTLLATVQKDDGLVDQIHQILERFRNQLGFVEFDRLIASMSSVQRSAYDSTLLNIKTNVSMTRSKDPIPKPLATSGTLGRQPITAIHPIASSSLIDHNGSTSDRYPLVSASVWDQIHNETDTRIRCFGLEALRASLEKMDAKQRESIIARDQVTTLLNAMEDVLDDLSYKVAAIALDILRLTATNFGAVIGQHIKQIISSMSKHFGNQKSLIKQLVMMISLETMQVSSARDVLAALTPYTRHRNSRVREEVLNLITAALLKLPSSSFHLNSIVQLVCPILCDSKRRVRLAAFELLAVLGQTLGAGKLDNLYHAIHNVEREQRVAGLMLAAQVVRDAHLCERHLSNTNHVRLNTAFDQRYSRKYNVKIHNARLARHQLPKIRYDGLIEYCTPQTVNNGDKSLADYEWIMSAAVGPDSHGGSLRLVGRPTSAALLAKRQTKSAKLSTLNSSNYGNSSNYTTTTSISRMGNGNGMRTGNLWEMPDQEDDEWQRHSAPVVGSKPVFGGNSSVELSNNDRESRHRKESHHRSEKQDPSLANSDPELIPTAKPTYTKSIDIDDYGRPSKDSMSPDQQSAPARPFFITPSTSKFGRSLNQNAHNNLKPPNGRIPKSSSLVEIEEPSRRSHDYDKKQPYRNGHQPHYPSTSYSEPKSHQQDSRDRHKPTIHKTNNRRESLDRPKEDNPKANSHVALSRLQSQSAEDVDPRRRNRSVPAPGHAKPRQIHVAQRSNKKSAGSSNLNLNESLKKISSEEWEDKVVGLKGISAVTESDPRAIEGDLHEVCRVVISECKNLRSSVCAQALKTAADLFIVLKRTMDPETDKMCEVLTTKSGDVSSAFIREEATHALEMMVDNVTPTRACNSLIQYGANQKAVNIRSSCGVLVQRLCENEGPTKVLTSKELSEKIIPTAVKWTRDAQAQPRTNGRSILTFLSEDKNFDSALRRYVNEADARQIQSVINKKR